MEVITAIEGGEKKAEKNRQSLITSYFKRQAAAPLLPEDVLREEDERDISFDNDDISEVLDFEGFGGGN